ncbi:hypothetical protein BDZ94DRAFT_1310610 [Collybia nuda]|uniref:Uncharacterized protein n=1 Tax=Collybia nuda TaxID=64659 RepID=A0A9P6CI31_9AGAR|nr:hypothetical protein BDZ94DRAFT_1310610 [Collybia nuda]
MLPNLDLNGTFGAFLIGVVISAAQVSALFALRCLHSILSTHAIYYYTISNYLNPTALLNSVWSLTVLLELSAILIFVVHIFYARRVYYVSRGNPALVFLVLALASAHCGTSIVITVKA